MTVSRCASDSTSPGFNRPVFWGIFVQMVLFDGHETNFIRILNDGGELY